MAWHHKTSAKFEQKPENPNKKAHEINRLANFKCLLRSEGLRKERERERKIKKEKEKKKEISFFKVHLPT